MAKKEGVRKLFDNIAPDYDKLNHILSLNIDKGWRKKAVRNLVDTQEPLKVLDVACGTADFTIEIAQKVAKGSEVIGVDISEGMMAVGREKIKKAPLCGAFKFRYLARGRISSRRTSTSLSSSSMVVCRLRETRKEPSITSGETFMASRVWLRWPLAQAEPADTQVL